MKPPFRALPLLLFVFTSVLMDAQSAPVGSASATLRTYVDLRLRWADWKEYSQLITWPDEPSWDCWWVAKKYDISRAAKLSSKVRIPVTYARLGLFCMDTQFELKPKVDTVSYELVHRGGVWRVDGPVPDYPYVGWQTVRDSLRNLIADESETTNRKEQARNTLQALLEAAGEKPE